MGIQRNVSADGSQELSRKTPAQRTAVKGRALLLYPFLSGYKQMPRSVLRRIAIIIICNDLILKCQHRGARNSLSPQSQCVVAIHCWHLPTAPAWYKSLIPNECKHATILQTKLFSGILESPVWCKCAA